MLDCASGLEHEALIGSVDSCLAQPVGETIAEGFMPSTKLDEAED